MRWFIFTALLALAGSVGADNGPALLVGAWSYHLNRSVEYNESHDLIGIRYRDFSVIKFTNSDYRESYGVGRFIPVTTWRGVALGAYVGAWTGYDEPVRPVVGATATVRWGPLSAVLTSAVLVNTLHFELAL